MTRIRNSIIVLANAFIFIFMSCSKENMQANQSNNNSSNPPSNPLISTPCSNRSEINATLIPIGQLSSARMGIKCAAAGNKILYIGGWHDGANYWNEPVPVDIFDISANSWSQHSLVPENPSFTYYRFGAAIATVGNKILFAGGGDPIGDNQTARVDIFDASSDSWSFNYLSAARSGLAASTAGDKVLFAGGFGYPDGRNWGEFNTVDIYDTSTNTWSVATLSQARSDLSATTAGSKIYFAGGHAGLQTSKIIDIYNAVSNTWSVASLNQPRAGLAGISTEEKIFWAGGHYFDGTSSLAYNNTVEMLNLQTGDITTDCLYPKSGFNAVRKEDNLIFFTGSNGNGYQFEIYDIRTDRWSIGKLSIPVLAAAIITVSNTVYVAGGKVNGAYSKQVWKLEF